MEKTVTNTIIVTYAEHDGKVRCNTLEYKRFSSILIGSFSYGLVWKLVH